MGGSAVRWINTVFGIPLGWIMWCCYRLTGSYVLSIILLTLISKVILLPLSIAVQKNSIKMVRLQPELNRITLRYFGDRDAIADHTMELYKRENYRPSLGMVPLLIQIFLVLGMIGVVYHPMQHLLHIDGPTCDFLVAAAEKITGAPHFGAGGQLLAIHAMADPRNTDAFLREAGNAVPELPSIMAAAGEMRMRIFGIDLGMFPSLRFGGPLLLIPFLSFLSSLVLCIAQNMENVLQREQGKLSQWGVTAFTVAFSTYFTFLVPAGVGFYWIVSNLFALAILYLMNFLYPPEKEIDYEALRDTQKKLDARKTAKKEERKRLRPYRKRETRDYRRFLDSKVKKQFVIYSESNGFYKYYAGMIDYIMEHSDVVIDYITSDPNDRVFQMEGPRFRAYYIGELRLIPLMMKMDADIVLMTMPDLELYHIKRSLVRKDIEYIYMQHGPGSDNMLGKPHCIDHYDTIFNVGPHQTAEDRELEKLYGIKPRRLVKVGYSLIDEMTAAWEAAPKKGPKEKKTVLIAPSWWTDNIMDSCIDKLVEQILPLDVKLIIRPHPQYIRLYPDRIEAAIERFRPYFGPDFEFQTDFSSTDTVYNADLLISDWSNVAMEFAFSTLKPVLHINTTMKVLNPDYKKIDIVPIDIWVRSEIGGELELDELDRAGEAVQDLLSRPDEFRESIAKVKEKAIYNIGHGGEAAGRYIIRRLEPAHE